MFVPNFITWMDLEYTMFCFINFACIKSANFLPITDSQQFVSTTLLKYPFFQQYDENYGWGEAFVSLFPKSKLYAL